MILFTLAGLAARSFLGWEPGVAVGLLGGFVVASLIPAKSACAVTRAPEPNELTKRP